MTRPIRVLILLAGLVAGQFILFGPSLIGSRVLAPLDILGVDRMYLSQGQLPPGYSGPFDEVFTDLVEIECPSYDFAATEIRAGRLPIWIPNIFAGAPFASFAKFSLFSILYYCWPSPFSLAWMQLAKSLAAGIGAYLFFRHVLTVQFWPAVAGAWCYPLTNYYMLWQGYRLSYVVCCLPWILLAVDHCVRRPHGRGGLLLAVFTAQCALAGQLDVAGLVLLGSGMFAIACLVDRYGKAILGRAGVKSIFALAAGWGLGLMLAAPYVVPLVEYARTGDRFIRRSVGYEERPPVGLGALPQIVLPNMYGATHRGTLFIAPHAPNLLESASTAYVGLLATLFLAPLAFSSRRHRFFTIAAIILTFISFSWVLNVPGVVAVMRLHGFNMLSYNRFTFIGAFFILAMSVIGLEQLSSGQPLRSPWLFIPAGVVLALACWCAYRCINLPEPVTFKLASLNKPKSIIWGMPAPQAIELVQHYFQKFYGIALALCVVALAGWAVVLLGIRRRPWMAAIAAAVAILDLLLYGYGINPQCDPALYYPRIPALVELREKFPPGRIIGVQCFPPNLSLTHGLRDIRGYDAVDPKLIMDLLNLASHKENYSQPHVRSQWLVPDYKFDSAGQLILPPALSMLDVRYIVTRVELPAQIQRIIHKEGYAVLENKAAMPRAFVPRTVQVITDERRRLERMGRSDFDPAEVAYVEQPVELPGRCRGSATITEEIPSQVTIKLDMQTPGLLVLADLWYAGWNAYLDGKPVPILRTNHALRGVIVPSGQGLLVFRYEPFSLRLGLLLAGMASLFIIGSCVGLLRETRQGRPAPA